MVTTEEQVRVEETPADNADSEEQETVQDTVAEPSTPETTEAEPVASSEPDATPPETPDVASLISGLGEQELEELPAVKDLLARRTESVRQSTEDKAKRELRQAEQQWLQSGDYREDLLKAMRIEGEGDSQTIASDPEQLGTVLERMIAAERDLAHEELTALINDRMGDAQVEAARVDQMVGLAQQVQAGRTPLSEFITAQLDLLRDVERERIMPELRQEIEKEVRADLEAGNTVSQRQETANQRSEQSSPTRGITGSSGAFFATQVQIDTAYNNGEITTQEYSEMRHDGRYDRLPWR